MDRGADASRTTSFSRIEVHAHQLDLERSYKRTDLFANELVTEDPWFVQLDLRTLVR